MVKLDLRKHMERHIPLEYREKLFCDKCKFVSFSATSMKSHKRYEHNVEGKKYACHCGKVYSKPGRLNAHKKYTHNNIKIPKTHYCTVCNKAFVSPSAVKVCIINIQMCKVDNSFHF